MDFCHLQWLRTSGRNHNVTFPDKLGLLYYNMKGKYSFLGFLALVPGDACPGTIVLIPLDQFVILLKCIQLSRGMKCTNAYAEALLFPTCL